MSVRDDIEAPASSSLNNACRRLPGTESSKVHRHRTVSITSQRRRVLGS